MTEPPAQNAESWTTGLWEAESFGAILKNGRTLPMQVGCVRRISSDGTKERREFLLKSVGHPEITTTSLFSEFTGNVLAQHFGINTPNPALVRISPEFVNATRRNPEFIQRSEGKIDLRAGVAVACEFISGLAPVQRDYDASLPRDIAEAARIFAFDMLVQNPDRTFKGKTNLALSQGRLIAFDFEMCFSFIFLIGGASDPWNIDPKMSRAHLFFRSLQGKTHDWTAFLDDLALLDSGKIDHLSAGLLEVFPNCRRSAEMTSKHLSLVRGRALDFRRELERSLG